MTNPIKKTDSAGSGGDKMGGSHNAINNEDGYISSIGIDDIQLLITDFEVDSSAQLRTNSAVDIGTGETHDRPLFQPNGEGPPVEGTKAYANPGPIGITIRGVDALFVDVSLPSLLDGDNLVPVDTKLRLETAIAVLHEKLRVFGITADIPNAKICRLDVFRDVQTENPLIDYQVPLGSLEFPYMERQRYGDGGYRWHNKSRQILLYPKGETMGENNRVQRLEYRVTRTRRLRDQMYIETVSELQDAFNRVRIAFRKAVRTLFPEEPMEVSSPPTCTRDAIASALDVLEEKSGSPHSDALQALGVRYLQKRESVDSFLEAIEEHGSRMAAHRYRGKIEKLSPLADLVCNQETTRSDMLSELRSKFLE